MKWQTNMLREGQAGEGGGGLGYLALWAKCVFLMILP